MAHSSSELRSSDITAIFRAAFLSFIVAVTGSFIMYTSFYGLSTLLIAYIVVFGGYFLLIPVITCLFLARHRSYISPMNIVLSYIFAMTPATICIAYGRWYLLSEDFATVYRQLLAVKTTLIYPAIIANIYGIWALVTYIPKDENTSTRLEEQN